MEIVQMVNPLDLWEALDGAVDSDGGKMNEYAYNLMTQEKIEEAFSSGDYWGEEIKNPICVSIGVHDDWYGDCRGRWLLGNGHHRLAYAIAAMLDEIPVVFTHANDYMMSYYTDGEGDWLRMVGAASRKF